MVPAIEALEPAEDSPKAAPGDLNHIRRFVNTLDLEDGSDDIAEPEALRAWLAERELIDTGAELSATDVRQADRKSTRLNSSHANISYAVFCLKKKNTSFFFLLLHFSY